MSKHYFVLIYAQVVNILFIRGFRSEVSRIIHSRNELRAMKVTIILAVLLALLLSKGDANDVRGFFFYCLLHGSTHAFNA